MQGCLLYIDGHSPVPLPFHSCLTADTIAYNVPVSTDQYYLDRVFSSIYSDTKRVSAVRGSKI